MSIGIKLVAMAVVVFGVSAAAAVVVAAVAWGIGFSDWCLVVGEIYYYYYYYYL
jgi:hypothetical protein